MRLQAVLFDLGGTLIYFTGEWPEVFTQANRALLRHLQASGIQLNGDEFVAAFRRRLDEYYAEREAEFIEYTTVQVLRELLAERGYPDISPETLSPAVDAMYAVSQTYWHTEDDAAPVLEALKGRGYRLGVISNAGHDPDVQALVDQADLRPYLDFVLSSAAVGIRKPNPRIFHLGLAHWGIEPSQAAMVGDTLGADILGARNAGIYSIWVTRRADTPANRDHAETIEPDATIACLSELPDLLDT